MMVLSFGQPAEQVNLVLKVYPVWVPKDWLGIRYRDELLEEPRPEPDQQLQRTALHWFRRLEKVCFGGFPGWRELAEYF